MPLIMPIKDLRNTTEISNIAHREQEPIFITKNGERTGSCMITSRTKFWRLYIWKGKSFQVKQTLNIIINIS